MSTRIARLAMFAVAVAIAGVVTLLPDAAQSATPSCAGDRATLVGTAGDDVLVGTNGPDVIVGGGGNDIIRGLGGRDILCAGPGQDTLRGGDGADVVLAGCGDDDLNGGAGKDQVDSGACRTHDHDVISAADRGNDVITARSRDVVLSYRSSRTAPVTVDVRAGTAAGSSSGHDRLVFPHLHEGVHIVGSGVRGDILLGGPGPDTLTTAGAGAGIAGRGGEDHLRAAPNRSRVSGGPGSDLIQTAPGKRTQAMAIYGGAGDDTIDARGRTVGAAGGSGNDVLRLRTPLVRGPGLQGGTGRDRVILELTKAHAAGTPYQQVVVDLDAGWVSTQGAFVVGLASIEDATVTDGAAVGGQPAPTARSYVIRGTAGAIALSLLDVASTGVTGRLFGEGGDDELMGGTGDDLLDGGEGTDVGNGRVGQDICLSVETPTNCETVHRDREG